MKRVISAFAVIAIVSSALAFKAPLAGAYCASTVQNTNCHIVPLKKEANGTPNFFVNPTWDGTAAGCVSTQCATAIRLIDQN